MNEYWQSITDLYNQVLSQSPRVQLPLWGLMATITVFLSVGFLSRNLVKKIVFFALALGVSLAAGYRVGDWKVFYPFFLAGPSLIISLIIYWITVSLRLIENEYTIKFVAHGNKFLIDLRRHLAVLGSSGAGKTDSIFIPLIKHFLRWGISVLQYDYKDWELTEKLLHYHEKQRQKNIKLQEKGKPTKPLPEIKNIYFPDPNLSHHINPLDPIYLEKMEDMESVAETLFANLYPGGDFASGTEKFFKESGAAAFAGTAWRQSGLRS